MGFWSVPEAAMSRCSNVRAKLLDHLVGAGEQRVGHGETKCLRGLEVDYKLILGWCLHWEVGGLLAPENAIDVASRQPVLINLIRPIGYQAPACDVVAEGIHG